MNQSRNVGVIVKKRTPDEPKESDNSAIEACAEQLIKSIKSNDIKGAAQAMQDAFDIMDSAPHIEGPHLNEGE